MIGYETRTYETRLEEELLSTIWLSFSSRSIACTVVVRNVYVQCAGRSSLRALARKRTIVEPIDIQRTPQSRNAARSRGKSSVKLESSDRLGQQFQRFTSEAERDARRRSQPERPPYWDEGSARVTRSCRSPRLRRPSRCPARPSARAHSPEGSPSSF